MKTQTSLVAQQTRLNEWAEQIRECKNRPHGMKIDEWCSQHGITKANYYWRLRKVREALLEAAESVPAFVELQVPSEEKVGLPSDKKTVAILKSQNHLTLEITDQADEKFLKTLLEVMIHAQ